MWFALYFYWAVLVRHIWKKTFNSSCLLEGARVDNDTLLFHDQSLVLFDFFFNNVNLLIFRFKVRVGKQGGRDLWASSQGHSIRPHSWLCKCVCQTRSTGVGKWTIQRSRAVSKPLTSFTRPWASGLTPLRLSFLIYKMGVIILPSRVARRIRNDAF